MTSREQRRSRVGSKGQVVIAKAWRKRYGIKEGSIIEQIPEKRGVLLVPLDPKRLMDDLEAAAEEIGKEWPKNLTAVEAIRKDREK